MERGAQTAGGTDAFAAVCAALWRQRDLLETLAEQLTPAAIDNRAAIADIQIGEVWRAAEVGVLTYGLGLPAEATLAAIAAAAPEPWQTLLLDHRDNLHRLYSRITALAVATGSPIRQQSLDDFLA